MEKHGKYKGVGRGSRRLVGVDDAGGTPVPIPNTEVKPGSAEDTWLETAWENRKMPTFSFYYRKLRRKNGVTFSELFSRIKEFLGKKEA